MIHYMFTSHLLYFLLNGLLIFFVHFLKIIVIYLLVYFLCGCAGSSLWGEGLPSW